MISLELNIQAFFAQSSLIPLLLLKLWRTLESSFVPALPNYYKMFQVKDHKPSALFTLETHSTMDKAYTDESTSRQATFFIPLTCIYFYITYKSLLNCVCDHLIGIRCTRSVFYIFSNCFFSLVMNRKVAPKNTKYKPTLYLLTCAKRSVQLQERYPNVNSNCLY